MTETGFENIVGKGENAGNQHFLPFPPCFLPSPPHISISNYDSRSTFILSSANVLNLENFKMLSLRKRAYVFGRVHSETLVSIFRMKTASD